MGAVIKNLELFVDRFEIPLENVTIKCGLEPQELEAVYRLRADVFCRELGWVGNKNDVFERDEFDSDTKHIGVFVGDQLVGTARIHIHSREWMLHSIFSTLIENTKGPDKYLNTCEISRLAVDRQFRLSQDHVMQIVLGVFKGVFVFCQLNNLRYLHMVTTPAVRRLMTRNGLPLRHYGEAKRIGGGAYALASQLDLVEFIYRNSQRNSGLLDEYLSALAQAKLKPMLACDDHRLAG